MSAAMVQAARQWWEDQTGVSPEDAGVPLGDIVNQYRQAHPTGGASAEDALNRDAGSRRVGSADLNAWGNLQQLLTDNPGAAAGLRAQGLMPSYNGVSLDQVGRNGSTFGVAPPTGMHAVNFSTYNPTAQLRPYGQNGTTPDPRSPTYGGGGATGGPSGATGAARISPLASPLPGMPGGAGGAGGAGGIGGGGGAMGPVPRTGLPLEGGIEGAYMDVLGKKGNLFTPGEQAGLKATSAGTIGRGTNDAIQSARLDAIRRGDTSGSSLGSREDKIRAGGATAINQSNLATDIGLKREANSNLMGAAAGAQGMFGQQLGNIKDLRQIELLKSQLAQSGGLNGGLNVLLGLGGK